MKRKSAILSIIIIFMLVYIIVSATSQNKYLAACSEANIPFGLTGTERAEKLKQCASCHAKEFQEEMIGPHAVSYLKLLEHRTNSDTSAYFPKGYEQHVYKNFGGACVSCHATENLYETNYKGLEKETDISRMTTSFYPHMKDFPVARAYKQSHISGVDCLTCHSAGNNVVTRADYVQKGTAVPPCKPIASKYFSSNNNCYSCHFVTNNSAADNIHNTAITTDKSCNSCHAEHDIDGKFTHYYYWRHDAKNKEQFPLLQAVFNDISITKLKGNTYAFEWPNQHSSHAGSECAEIIAQVNFVDSNGNSLMKQTIRLNNKAHHDPELVSYFSDKVVPGQYGCHFEPNDTALKKIFRIGSSKTVRKIIIEGYDKAQYWIDDRAGVKVFSKEIVI